MQAVERSRLLRKFMIFEGLWAIGVSGKDNRKLFWIVRAKTNSLMKMKSLNPLFEKVGLKIFVTGVPKGKRTEKVKGLALFEF